MSKGVLTENTAFRGRKLSGGAKAFLYGLVTAVIVFLPFMLVNQGYFLYYGDFNVQQIPFYRMCHDAIRNGNLGWSHTTDLGANFIGSYTFYLIGSPFFWLTLPFPSAAVPYLMGPLFMLKFACASLTGYLYVRRYVRYEQSALIAALLYAFSGYSVYNVFFNHFHEAIIIFPLLLYSMDEYMYNRRRGVFAAAVFAACFVNYYFFVGQVTFCLIYWFVRMFSKSWRISFRDFLLLALEAVLGVLMSCVLLVPSCLAVLQNPRVSNDFNGWNALIYNVNQRYVHIIQCFFFPPDIPARPNFTPDSQSKWASLGAYLPMFSMAGVIAWIQAKKGNWLRRILCILFVMAFIPVLNSSFQLFNASYYARWFYMLTLMMALATVKGLESASVNWKSGVLWTFGIVAAMSIAIGLMPHKSGDLKNADGEPVTVFGLEDYPTRFWSYVAFTLAGLLLFTFLYVFYRKKKKVFLKAVTFSVAFLSVIYSIFIISLGKTQSADPGKSLIPYSLNGGKDLSMKDELQECRSDFYDSLDNAAMFWQIPSIQAFHSIVPGSIMEFYPSIGVTRDVGSRADTTHYALRGFTSCKWLFDDATDSSYFGGEDYTEPEMPGWSFYGTENGFDVWKNDYYIPMGFTYDQYITRETYEGLSESSREKVMLKAIVLENEDVALYGNLFKQGATDEYRYTEEAYLEDCKARAAVTATGFAYDKDSFSAKFTADRETLVFFSVPIEDGWSAQVNGEDARIVKVNVGFMAVKVLPGENEIVFRYKTPGLKAGTLVSLAALILFLLYLFLAGKLHADRDFLPYPNYRAGRFEDYRLRRGCSFTGAEEPAPAEQAEWLPQAQGALESDNTEKGEETL